MIIGFTGPIGSGKTTAAKYMEREFGAKRISFAAPLKRMAQRIYSLSDEQVYGTQEQKETIDPRHGKSPRDLLQFLGTDVCRDLLGEDVWVDAALRNLNRDNLYVCDDVRFHNEVSAIRYKAGVIIKLVSPGSPYIVNAHVSELYNLDYDYAVTCPVGGPFEQRIREVLYSIGCDARTWARSHRSYIETRHSYSFYEEADPLIKALHGHP